jgi:hypothetical protein
VVFTHHGGAVALDRREAAMTDAADEAEIQNETHSAPPPIAVAQSLRHQFLNYAGFRWDAFAQPVAEQEYGFTDDSVLRVSAPDEAPPLVPQPDDIPDVFARAYYVDPRYDDWRAGSVFDELRAPGHALVYGRPGDGKSTLRLAVETHVRAYPDNTLVVTYEPGRAVEHEVDQCVARAPTADAAAAARDAHLRQLAAALAVDLFIQIIEQFSYRLRPPSAKQNQAFCTLITTLEPRLKQVLERLMRGDPPADLWGFAWLWRRLDRPIVQPVGRTSAMRAWFKTLRRRARRGKTAAETPTDGASLWQQALDAARIWGFERVYVMLDGVDTYWRQPPDMLDLLDPILRLVPDFTAQGVSLKAFLPRELAADVARRLVGYGVALDRVLVIQLEWTKERLEALVLVRYRAAGSRRLGLGDMVEASLRPEIDDMLLAAADGSPRRLLLILNSLILAHISDTEQPVERPITRAEWDSAVAQADRLMAS